METLSEKITEIIKPKTEDNSGVSDTDCSPKEVIRELKECFYSGKDIRDFGDFKIQGKYPSSGEYSFSIESKYLKYACGILKHTAVGGKLGKTTVKVLMFKNQLKMSGCNHISFAEVFVPLSCNSAIEEPVFFVFDFNILQKITNSFEKSVLDFTYFANKLLIKVVSGNTCLELPTNPEIDFERYAVKIKDIKETPCLMNVPLLKTAFDYISLFLKKDDNQPHNSLIECRDKTFLGGNTFNIGLFYSEVLDKNPMKLKYDALGICNKILPYFYPSSVKLFETENYYILRDQNVYVGFGKVPESFPSVKGLIGTKVDDSYVVSRESLIKALDKLSVVTINKDNLVKMKVTSASPGSTQTTSLVLEVAVGDSGRSSKDILPILREAQKETRVYFVNLEMLQKTLSFFKTKDVKFFEMKDKAILIKDEDDLYTATTIISTSKDA